MNPSRVVLISCELHPKPRGPGMMKTSDNPYHSNPPVIPRYGNFSVRSNKLSPCPVYSFTIQCHAHLISKLQYSGTWWPRTYQAFSLFLSISLALFQSKPPAGESEQSGKNCWMIVLCLGYSSLEFPPLACYTILQTLRLGASHPSRALRAAAVIAPQHKYIGGVTDIAVNFGVRWDVGLQIMRALGVVVEHFCSFSFSFDKIEESSGSLIRMTGAVVRPPIHPSVD